MKREKVDPKEEKDGTYPNIEFNIFIRYCLDVESDCWDCSHRLIELEFIQYRWWLVLVLISEKDWEREEGCVGRQIEEVGFYVGRYRYRPAWKLHYSYDRPSRRSIQLRLPHMLSIISRSPRIAVLD